MIKIVDSFSETPQSSINEACQDWAEAKAAYRFLKMRGLMLSKF